MSRSVRRSAAVVGGIVLAAAALAAAPEAPAHAHPVGPSVRAVPSLAADTPYVTAANDSVGGEYLTTIGGCNDCHTPGWDRSNGRTPAAERFVGNPVGYRGPWGTSYAVNLRLLTQRFTEDRWVQVLTTSDDGHGRPPMPWMNTAMMHQRDLRAMYRYIRSLGPAGERMPRAVPADSQPRTPFIWMVPQQPTRVRK